MLTQKPTWIDKKYIDQNVTVCQIIVGHINMSERSS